MVPRRGTGASGVVHFPPGTAALCSSITDSNNDTTSCPEWPVRPFRPVTENAGARLAWYRRPKRRKHVPCRLLLSDLRLILRYDPIGASVRNPRVERLGCVIHAACLQTPTRIAIASWHAGRWRLRVGRSNARRYATRIAHRFTHPVVGCMSPPWPMIGQLRISEFLKSFHRSFAGAGAKKSLRGMHHRRPCGSGRCLYRDTFQPVVGQKASVHIDLVFAAEGKVGRNSMGGRDGGPCTHLDHPEYAGGQSAFDVAIRRG